MRSYWVWCVVCVAVLSGGPFVAVSGAQEEGALRLQGGTAKAGRLEIYHNGQWGTVCDDEWGRQPRNAGVACRQLGHTGRSTFYTAGGGSGPIWLDTVACTGTETRLAACQHEDWGVHDCGHWEDVGVACAGASPPPPPPLLTARFDPAPPATHGADPFTVRIRFSAEVATKPRAFKRRGLSVTGGTVTRVRRVQRRKDWWQLTIQPTAATTAVTIAVPAHRACTARGAICTADGRPLSTPLRYTVRSQSTPTANEGALRLQGGTAKRGRLEVYHHGEWGTVCDDRFTNVTAGVACKQLGYTGGTFYTAGGGSGPIWLDSLACTGTESRVAACRNDGWGVHDCSHAEDVGVACAGPQPMVRQSPQPVPRRAPAPVAPPVRPDRGLPAMPDAVLRTALRQALAIAPGVPLTAAALASVTTLDLSGAGISDLSGLEQARNLETLFLADNQIIDLSPLAGLVYLQSLSLGGNQITDLRPLAALVHLEFLSLADNRITDLWPLAELVGLEFLFIAGNQITDFSPLAGLPRVSIDGQAAQVRPQPAQEEGGAQ